MPLTVAGVEAETIARVGGKWALAQLSPATDGTNPDLRSPVRRGLRYVGVAPADPAAATDDDLLLVPASKAETYMDAVAYEAVLVCLGRMPDGYDQQVEQEKQSLHQVMTDLEAMADRIKADLPRLNVPKPVVGTLAAGSVMPNDDLRRCGNPTNFHTWPYPQ